MEKDNRSRNKTPNTINVKEMSLMAWVTFNFTIHLTIHVACQAGIQLEQQPRSRAELLLVTVSADWRPTDSPVLSKY